MSNVRISESTCQTVLDKAVEEYRHRRFWDQVEAAASNLRKDSAAWNGEMSERQAWDATLADGLEVK
jgi:hypothetical protein